MDRNTEVKKRHEFKEILRCLCAPNALDEKAERITMYFRLENLYYSVDPKEQFRHFYSDIFIVLTEIDAQGAMSENTIDYLGFNIEIVRKGYRAKNYDINGNLIDVSDNIKKLCDHVSLDLARLRYSAKNDRELTMESRFEELQASVNAKTEDKYQDFLEQLKIKETEIYEKIEKTANSVQDQLNNTQKEYIAILGIFASVVLTFVGGMTFSTSVLQNISDVSIYRLLFTIDALALVLINTINLLLKFIWKLHGKETTLFKSIKWINIICAILALLIVIAWAFNFNQLSVFLGDNLPWVKASLSVF